MSHLHGFSLTTQRLASKDDLTSMLARAGDEPERLSALIHGASAMAAPVVAETNGLLVAATGRPHWSDQGLQRLANDSGLAESIAAGYRQHGTDVLQRLHGPFALAVIDADRQELFLAIDRLGIEPLAWAAHEGGVVFSSDAAAIQSYAGVDSTIDPQALFDYFYFHMIPSPHTIYAGTQKLLPAQYVRITNGQAERKIYWSPRYEEVPLPERELAGLLRERLEQAVASATDSAPTGTFLSGGLDSSTVSGYFAQLAEGQADAYGIGFDADGYDEMEYARAAARHYGIQLHEYYVTPTDVADAVPKVAAAYDEPFGNASAIPAYFCARVAKEDGKDCLLAGDGGDEIFAGNARYAKQQVFELYSHIPIAIRNTLIEPLADHFPLGDRITPVRKLRSYIQQARMPMPERMESYNFLHRTPLEDIFAADFLGSVDPTQPITGLRQTYRRADTESLVKRMLYLDLKITLADNDLRKVSRMCQLAGIDVRYPMLDEALVDFSATIPTRLLLKPNRLRHFYRRALADFLPPETLAKRKHGFGLPFGVWMAKDRRLRELADDSLVALKKRGFVRPEYMDRLIEAHRSEHADYYGVMIWVMMMLEQWLQAHQVSIS